MTCALALALWLPAVTWRSYEEVFDLAGDGPAVFAATNGGLLRREGGAWRPVDSPSGLRAIEAVRPLVVRLADGRTLRQEGAAWRPAEPIDRTGGAELDPSVAAPAHPYVRLGDLVGTADGLYRREGDAWTRESLPSALPLARPNGLSSLGGEFVVGGLGGLFVGRPGAWRKVADDAIRQVVGFGGAAWAVHGSGAVDKLEGDRLYPDLLTGSARRPWTSCVGTNGATPIFGGLGGWEERPGGRYPGELRGDVVTAILGAGGARWVGSQKNGLLRFDKAGTKRWDPGNGLPDVWTTALLPTPQGLVVGTARRGLFRVRGERIASLPSPTERVTVLALWKGRLVVGGMDGAWIARGPAWASLGTRGEETTALALLDGRLAVVTAAGVSFVNPS